MAVNFFHFFVLFSLLSVFSFISALRPLPQDQKAFSLPPCNSGRECPSYDVIHTDKEFEIRRYNSTIWMTTAPISETSIVKANGKGVLQLFLYIQGNNKDHKKIEMAAPVLTEVTASAGASSFNVNFYISKANQDHIPPPEADGLHVTKLTNKYAAVKQFGGFLSDSKVGKQAALLEDSLAGTEWGKAVNKTRAAHPSSVYSVAQYNSPIELINRVNEIWMLFDMDENITM